VRTDFQARLEDSETLRQRELSELQTNFERKYQRFKEFQIDIEKINVELQEQNQHVREQFKGKEEEVDRLLQERQALER
jgi:predicted  nucleic acid-binding Zn-ribbon protein